MRKLAKIVAVLLAVMAVATQTSATPYEFVDLGNVPAPCGPCQESISYDIADDGSAIVNCDDRPVIWSNGIFTPLGKSGARAVGFNGTTVIGVYPGHSNTGFSWTGGFTTPLGFWPSKINRLGNVVGNIGNTPIIDGNPFTVSFADEGATAVDVNDHGQVTGTANTGGHEHGYLWVAGTATDLGSLWNYWSRPSAVNNLGHVVGATGDVNGFFQPFFRDGSASQLIPTPDGQHSWAQDVNDNDQVVGYFGFGDPNTTAFLWDQGVTCDLNTRALLPLGWHLGVALAINSSGWIVGYGSYQGQIRRAFLLRPVETVGVRATSWSNVKTLYR